ncbi:flagellin [Blastococcus sp. TF02A-30]|uniref:flagellin N-terminal helical domain-containing protein n=1 Tax=Blastococcus sp. TF02A-30 TaxID=2250580 RepID=UPI000DE95D0B|nr:flagellin [Blastococcus sp. TF02A-30]RBY89536.1 flagellin [Blastococcus sp. TF02A-30]
MGLRVNNNIAALNAYRNLSITDNQMSKSLEKLSSGFRINRAADDAAGLAISEGLRSQIGGLKVAVRNTQDGISVVQTAEGALTETTSILQRMRDLSVQAANDGGLNTDAKNNIQKEVEQLKEELTRIADTTKFNGEKLLDGNFSKNFQVGANQGEVIEVEVGTSMSAVGLEVNDVDVTTGGNAWTAASGSIDFDAAAAPGTAIAITYAGSTHTLDLSDWSTGATSADAEKNHALVQSQFDKKLQGTGLSAQVDAYGGVVISGPSSAAAGDVTAAGLTVAHSTSGSGADSAIQAIDAALKTVSTARADLGAKQNRFDHTINNLNVAVENLTASESRIRDADMAQEMVGFTRNQILTQAGTAMLAQANQASQGVLSLLR